MLFQKFENGKLSLINRFVRSATGEGMSVDGVPGRGMAEMYRELAEGEIGLIITGHSYVHPSGRATIGMTGVHTDEVIGVLSDIASAVHEAKTGSKVFVQINHAGRQAVKGAIDCEPWAPSPVPYQDPKRPPPREITADDVATIIKSFADAASRVKKAGFDGVQIHAAHGYLISQFLSPYLNRRTDEWGGSREGRFKFLEEVYKAIRSEVGDNYPTGIKINCNDFIEGGVEAEDAEYYCGRLVELGIDLIELSGSIADATRGPKTAGISEEWEEAYFLPYHGQIRQVTGDVPLAVVGGMRSRKVMEKIIDEGKADLISICRPFIREPDLVKRLRDNQEASSDCISCWGCLGHRGGVKCLNL